MISIFYCTIIKQFLLCSQGIWTSPNNSIDNVRKIIQS